MNIAETKLDRIDMISKLDRIDMNRLKTKFDIIHMTGETLEVQLDRICVNKVGTTRERENLGYFIL